MENKRDLTLTRVVGAPRELVYKAFTDPVLLAKWWGPRMFTTQNCEVDAEVDGKIYLEMVGPDNKIYPMGGKFIELVPPEKIVFENNALADDKHTELMHGLCTVTLEDFHGMTRMVIHEQLKQVSDGMEMAIDGMEQGWSESLYKLADVLDQQQ